MSLAASSAALKLATNYSKHNRSYQNLNVQNNRATQSMLSAFRLALQIYKAYFEQVPNFK
jgi:hypothetical protein